MPEKAGEKGYALEELLRAYFIRAGVYAVRSVPLRFNGDDLTDVDIWLYERPTGSSRRRQIVDAKSKVKPKAIERLLWTKGLYELLEVEGAYIATTDTRPMLKEMSRRLGLSVLDGDDIKKMAESEKVIFLDRLSEEQLNLAIKRLDQSRKNKEFQNSYLDLKASLIDNFGGGTVNRALEHVGSFSVNLLSSHPNSDAAELSLRLMYLSASISAIAMDYALTKVSFKSPEERRKKILSVIRYGVEDEEKGFEKIRLAIALIEKYAPNGRAISHTVMQSVRSDFAKVPAEIIADHIMTHLKAGDLFRLARALELRAFSKDLVGFDDLPGDEKAFVAVLLDFAGIDRAGAANGWQSTPGATIKSENIMSESDDHGPLFGVRTRNT